MFTLDGCIDAYTTEFQAVVEDMHDSWIILDETSFRPDTAARESDIGIIDDIPVSRVVEGHDGSILHLLDDLGAAHSIKVGQAVYGKIDWSGARAGEQARATARRLMVDYVNGYRKSGATAASISSTSSATGS